MTHSTAKMISCTRDGRSLKPFATAQSPFLTVRGAAAAAAAAAAPDPPWYKRAWHGLTGWLG